MYSTGVPECSPIMLGPNIQQYEAGAAAAVVTLGTFLLATTKGIGQHVDVAIIEAVSLGGDRRSGSLVAYQYCGEVGPRIPAIEAGYPYGPHPCEDGYFDVQGGRMYWDRVVRMLGSPEYLLDPKWTSPTAQSDPSTKEEFDVFYLTWLMQHKKRECADIGQAAGVPCAPLNTIEEVVNDPHFNARGLFVEFEHPVAGKIKCVGRPFIMSEGAWMIRRPAPLLGQHNEEVFRHLGYTKEDLVKLRQQNVI